MKPLFKNILLSLIFMFGLQGCYTIIWSPEEEFPTAQNSGDVYYNLYYYDNNYEVYYEYPWWYRISSPILIDGGYNPRNSDNEALRNTDGGRRSGGSTPILTPDPPGRSSGNSSGSNTEKSGSSGNSRNSSNDSSRNTDSRNSDSGRNTDKGRR